MSVAIEVPNAIFRQEEWYLYMAGKGPMPAGGPQNRQEEWYVWLAQNGGGGGGGDNPFPVGTQGQYAGYNASGAGVAISPDTTPTANSNKLITSGAVYSAIAAFPKGLVYKGAVNYYASLPTSGQTIGDVYTVKYAGTSGTTTDGTEYAWGNYEGSAQWIAIGPDVSNIVVELNNKADRIEEVTVSTSGDVTQALNAETVYHFTSAALTSLTVTLAAAASGEMAQYHFDFTSGETAATLTLPDTVKIDLDGTAGTGVVTYTMDANTRYEIDILNGYGVISEWTI